MVFIIQSIPKTIPVVGNTYLFGSEWLVTITGADNMLDMVYWCYENYGEETIIHYYKHGTDKWSLMDATKAAKGYVNNINDSLRVRFKNEEDVMAFKLTWLE